MWHGKDVYSREVLIISRVRVGDVSVFLSSLKGGRVAVRMLYGLQVTVSIVL